MEINTNQKSQETVRIWGVLGSRDIIFLTLYITLLFYWMKSMWVSDFKNNFHIRWGDPYGFILIKEFVLERESVRKIQFIAFLVWTYWVKSNFKQWTVSASRSRQFSKQVQAENTWVTLNFCNFSVFNW